jgi:hypothetical protein
LYPGAIMQNHGLWQKLVCSAFCWWSSWWWCYGPRVHAEGVAIRPSFPRRLRCFS